MCLKIKHKTLTSILLKLLLIFAISNNVSATQHNIGMVLDEKLNKPLIGVNIYLKSAGNGTTTNENGEFNLKKILKINEKDTLYFSYVGYVTKRITLSELKENNFIVLLSENVQNLKGVTIISKSLLKPEIHYKKLASLKDGLYSFGSLLIGDEIYVIAGDASFDTGTKELKEVSVKNGNIMMKQSYSWQDYNGNLQKYSISTDKWTRSNLKFRKRAYHNIHFFNDKIYVLGGKRFSTNKKFEYLDNDIEVYDIKTDKILVDNTNPHQAVNFASFTYNDNIIVVGGSTQLKQNGEKEYSKKAHMLNLKTGYWYELNDMPQAKETKGVLIDNTIYLLGGFNNKPLKEIETYNLMTEKWETEGQLYYEVERPAVTYNGNIIYIFENGKIQTYNIETKELNVYLIDLSLKFSEIFCTNNILYLLGGLQGNEVVFLPSSDLYSIDLSEFKKSEVYTKLKNHEKILTQGVFTTNDVISMPSFEFLGYYPNKKETH